MTTVFILSPPNCGGARARMLLSSTASFPLARELRSATGAELGDVFTFLSGLYFRGKLAYARRFASVPAGVDVTTVGCGVLIVTPGAGLRPPETRVTPATLQQFATIAADPNQSNDRMPLDTSGRALLRALDPEARVVVLGSITTSVHVDILLAIFGDRLVCPAEFVGRGDMSRGSRLLRAVAAGTELNYRAVVQFERHVSSPPPPAPPSKTT